MQIRIYPDPILRKKCLALKDVTQAERQIFQEMLQQMRQEAGVGLAACQLGLEKQMLVVDLGENALKLANPKICERSGSQSIEEGCLSLPQIQVKVKRAKKIKVQALNEHNQKISLDAQDLLAIVLQHEIDHLQGRLIIDYLPWYKRIKAIGSLRSIKAKLKFQQRSQAVSKPYKM